MKKCLILILLVLFSVLFITGCSKLSKYAGTYKLDYYKYVGDPEISKNSEDWVIILEKDGTGKSKRYGSSYDVEWSMNDEEIKLIEKYVGISNEYNGTIKNGRLDIFNGDKTMSITQEAVFNKQ